MLRVEAVLHVVPGVLLRGDAVDHLQGAAPQDVGGHVRVGRAAGALIADAVVALKIIAHSRK